MPNYRAGTGAVVLRELPYFRRVLGIRPVNLVGYWPVSESATTAGANSIRDASSKGNNATPANVILGSSGIRVGRVAGAFNGLSSQITVNVGSMAAGFNGNEGSMMLWLRVASASIWTDATFLIPFRVGTDATNYMVVQKAGATANMNLTRSGSGTAVGFPVATGSTLNWFCLGYSWSVAGSYVKTYFNGNETTINQVLTNYVGNVTNSTIGANLGSLWWSGFICHVALWNTQLNAGEMTRLAKV